MLSPFLIGTLREDLYIFTNRIPVFVVGVIIGLLIQKKNIEIGRQGWITLILINILGVYFSYLTIFKDYFLFVPHSRCCIPFFLTAFSFVFLFAKLCDLLHIYGNKKVASFSSRILMLYGLISYEFYCFQQDVIKWVFENNSMWAWGIKFLTAFIVNTLVALVISKLFTYSFLIIEKKFGTK